MRHPSGRHLHEDDLVDAAWLYEWSRTALRPIGQTTAARLTFAD